MSSSKGNVSCQYNIDLHGLANEIIYTVNEGMVGIRKEEAGSNLIKTKKKKPKVRRKENHDGDEWGGISDGS
jgi:hypothetical protein